MENVVLRSWFNNKPCVLTSGDHLNCELFYYLTIHWLSFHDFGCICFPLFWNVEPFPGFKVSAGLPLFLKKEFSIVCNSCRWRPKPVWMCTHCVSGTILIRLNTRRTLVIVTALILFSRSLQNWIVVLHSSQGSHTLSMTVHTLSLILRCKHLKWRC